MNPTDPRFLMCPPSCFGVDYVINPWMQGHVGDVDRSTAIRQWALLRRILEDELGAEVQTIEPVPGLPDMVFTANAAIVHDGAFVPSRFRFEQRRGEEPCFEAWLTAFGLTPIEVAGFNEGAGDLLFGAGPDGGTILFAASGFRTDAAVHPRLADALGVEVVSLELVNPKFYHLDTCFCPLPEGRLLWYPGAFSGDSARRISEIYRADRRFEVSQPDAERFACNAVAVGGGIVVNDCDRTCGKWLTSQGFCLHRTPLSEFMKAGGAAKCLTLRIDTGRV